MMENIGLGAGLAALAFWGFVGTVVVAGIWDNIRKRDTQHETLRRLIESGQPLDQELMQKLSLATNSADKRHDRDMVLTGLWLLPVAVGMAILSIFMGDIAREAESAILGVSGLLACMGIGTIAAGKYIERWYVDDK
jgi:hypothetical protein